MLQRLMVINNILTPYNLSFFTALAQTSDIRTRVVLLSPSDTNRDWKVRAHNVGFEHRVLTAFRAYIHRLELPVYAHWGLWGEMRRFRPDVIAICGYHYVATLEVLAFARRHQARTVLWSGSHLLSGFIKRRWAEAYKRWVITQFDSYLSYGSAAQEQLIHYGAPADRIVVGCNTVDVHWFARRAAALRRSAPPPGGRTRFLYVGRLVPIKNVAALIASVGALQRRGMAVSLGIVGDGPERLALQQLVVHDGVQNVEFLGFRSNDALVDAYISADALVLPSVNEPWGLVVNEAAACALPSIASIRAGATRDLIQHGETGLRFDPASPGELERALERIAQDPAASRRMGKAAQKLILTRDPRYYAARLVEAARLALTIPTGAQR